MLFMVQMQVNIPATLDKAVADQLKKDEKEMSQKLQREGKWRDLWRVVGQYANVSIFNVSGNDELHNILSALPLSPFMTISVTPLTQHPSAIAQIGSFPAYLTLFDSHTPAPTVRWRGPRIYSCPLQP